MAALTPARTASSSIEALAVKLKHRLIENIFQLMRAFYTTQSRTMPEIIAAFAFMPESRGEK
ncbi:MAG: hypothetical protein E7K17_07345 [Klebsiella michiganensis]|nr:hypothetical protein [Klebsiella michiganensis]